MEILALVIMIPLEEINTMLSLISDLLSMESWANETANYVDSSIITAFNDSIFVPVDTIYDTLNFYYRIPIVENNSISDIYDAEVELDVIASDFGFDTFRMEVKIRDQAFNTSNTVVTEQMIVQP